MAHNVTLNLNTNIVLHKDVEIVVHTDEGKLGTLLVSKGNIEWLPFKKSVNKHRLGWKKFAELMESQGKPAKAKK
ncbi:MAG TPA: hypothetical protein VIM41_03770 [Gammaproteobacteria bacterium]